MYDTYEGFVRKAVRDYYERGFRQRKGNFIALILASGQIVGIAADSLKEGGAKKAALGAVGVVALRYAFRYFLSGPLGLLLSAAAVGSAVTYLVRHQKEITDKVGPYRTLIEETRSKYDEIQGGYRGGRYDTAGRNLMIDGLLKRFLEQIDER